MKKQTQNDPLISVIIPVYNTLQYLPKCLDSVLCNTYRSLEVICIDDGSNDGSSEVLHSYAQKDPRIRIITQENKGVPAARNAGMDQASGDFIAFNDSDDWIHPQYFEILVKAAEYYNADITACRMNSVVSTADIVAQAQEGDLDITKISRKECKVYRGKSAVTAGGITGCSVMWKLYRADLLRNVRFQDEIRIEDLPFDLETVCVKDDILCVCIPLKLYYYRRHAGSLSGKITANDEYQMAVYFYHQGIEAAKKHLDHRAYAFILHAMKRGILLRYRFMFHPEQKQICDQLVKACLQQFLTLKTPGHYEIIRYRLLTNIPLLYHLGHLLKRPADIQWELRYLKKTLQK